MVRDEAFLLESWLLRPFPSQGILEDQRIFIYRLSRAKRVVENAYSILSTQWSLMSRPIQSSLETKKYDNQSFNMSS